VGPSVRLGKRKRKGKGSARFWAQRGLSRLEAHPVSAWLHGSARPAAQQADSILGLAGHVGRLGVAGRPTAHPYLSLSLTTRAQGAAPRISPDRRDPLVGLPLDLVWLPDLVWLGLRVPVHVCECQCVWCASRGCSRKCPRGLAVM
jgi:hypothetical protein